MDTATPKTNLKVVGRSLTFLAVAGALIALLIRSPKEADWIYYSPKGKIIEGAFYDRCRGRITRQWGKCRYIDILLGANVSSVTSEPELGANIDGVKVIQHSDGRCRIFVRNDGKTVSIRNEKGQSRPGSARLSAAERRTKPLITVSVPSGLAEYDSLTYREPTDFVRWKIDGRDEPSSRNYRSTGWAFIEAKDQIVGIGLLGDDSVGGAGVMSVTEDAFEDRSRVEAYEKGVIADAFAWRDDVLARFSSNLGLEVPTNCEALQPS